MFVPGLNFHEKMSIQQGIFFFLWAQKKCHLTYVWPELSPAQTMLLCSKKGLWTHLNHSWHCMRPVSRLRCCFCAVWAAPNLLFHQRWQSSCVYALCGGCACSTKPHVMKTISSLLRWGSVFIYSCFFSLSFLSLFSLLFYPSRSNISGVSSVWYHDRVAPDVASPLPPIYPVTWINQICCLPFRYRERKRERERAGVLSEAVRWSLHGTSHRLNPSLTLHSSRAHLGDSTTSHTSSFFPAHISQYVLAVNVLRKGLSRYSRPRSFL